jgi:uncharacterized protein YbaR (Trm112 family)
MATVITLQCPQCRAFLNVVELSESEEPEVLKDCCRNTIGTVANVYNIALMKQFAQLMKHQVEHQQSLNDRIFDAAMLSEDPEVRREAIKYRNLRAEQKSQGSD